MQLLAAAQRATRLKRVIVKSSTAVYGSSPSEPSIIPEDHAARDAALSGYGRDCAEAEQYTRDFGRRRPDVDLVILRTQNVVGRTVRTNITEYLALPVVPTALGYDPRLQFLHEEDAVEALFAALAGDRKGIFNIAADGIVYLSQAIRMMGRTQMPLFLPAAQSTAGILRRLGIVDFPTDQLKLILFGRVVDTRRAKAALGFSPRFSSMDALVDLRDHRAGATPEPTSHPTWERELFEFLKQRSADDKEKV
jgi:UDP-glucose 4-epimerase